MADINPKTGKPTYYKDNKETKRKQNAKQMYVNGKYIPHSHPFHKPGRYIVTDEFDLVNLEKDTAKKEGYVYIITNPAWPDWVKIGMAEDVNKRLESFNTSAPLRDYVLEYSVYTNDRRDLEQKAHSKAIIWSLEYNNEWFKMTVGSAKDILDELNGQHNGLPTKASKVTKENKLQKCSQQEDLWTYAENREAERAVASS